MDQRVPDPHELKIVIAQLRSQTEEFKRNLQYAAMNLARPDRIARRSDSQRDNSSESKRH